MPDRLRHSRKIVLALMAVAALVDPVGDVRAQAAEELPLTGSAYESASQAYEAFSRGDYAAAVTKARDAIRQRPDVNRLRRLLVEALAASGDLEEADRTASGFVEAGIQDPELVQQRDRVRERISQRAIAAGRPGQQQTISDPSFQAADRAYKAYARKDYATAIEQARKAVELDPDRRDYRLLLINTLSAGKRPEEAERVATAALADHPGDGEILAQRGYIRVTLRRHAAAADDFAAALQARRSPVRNTRALRLALADASLTAKQPQRALDALKGLRGERSYAVAARAGFALLALGRREEALDAFRNAASHGATAQEKATVTSAEIGLLVDLDRRDEARRRFAEAQSVLSPLAALDLAYLANRVGDDRTADEHFSRARAAGQLKGLGYVDAAYAAKRLYKNDSAAELLKAAIDEAASGRLAIEPQYLFGLRREVGELERTWGAYASLLYGTVGVMPSVPFAPVPTAGNVLQAGTEIYWRPPGIGYRNGAIVEVFGRVFQTLSDETDGPTGISTAQGSVGARWKPFSSFNLVLEASRLFPIGEYARTDGLLRAAFSDGRGTDLRVDVSDWWTWQVYGDLGYYVEEKQTVGAFEARVGRSFRMDGISNRLVLTPFLSVGGGYDSLLDTPEAVGAGAGLNLRYWFRESKHTAPMSFIDINVQYRAKLAGDDRAQGAFAGITVSY
jgi:tetratricopeptide (TPR) repeat protein